MSGELSGFPVTIGVSLADNVQRELQKSGQGYVDKQYIFQNSSHYYNKTFSSFWDSYIGNVLRSKMVRFSRMLLFSDKFYNICNSAADGSFLIIV